MRPPVALPTARALGKVGFLDFASRHAEGGAGSCFLEPVSLKNLNHVHTALVVIDVQRAFEEWESAGRRRNNTGALRRIGQLLAAFRQADAAIFHIRHRGEPGSSFEPHGTGFAVLDEARELAGEPVIEKTVNNAFIGTDLEQRLRAADIDTVVICGATTNHCVKSSTRMAGNLGFVTRFVGDATWTFDLTGPDGRLHRAEEIQAMTEANLSGEFAEIVCADDVIRGLASTASLR